MEANVVELLTGVQIGYHAIFFTAWLQEGEDVRHSPAERVRVRLHRRGVGDLGVGGRRTTGRGREESSAGGGRRTTALLSGDFSI